MSEPVGNSPRGVIPSNTIRERETQSQDSAPRERAASVVTGKVITRKPSWFKRAAAGMVSDDADTIGEYILFDVLIPTFKTLIREVVVGSVDRTLFGASARGSLGRPGIGQRSGSQSSLRTKYDHISAGGDPRERPMSVRARATHDFDEILLGNRQEAINVVSKLMEMLAEYKTVSVADLYDLCGKTSGSAERAWGWKNLEGADVIQYRGHWLLDLPKPLPLRD